MLPFGENALVTGPLLPLVNAAADGVPVSKGSRVTVAPDEAVMPSVPSFAVAAMSKVPGVEPVCHTYSYVREHESLATRLAFVSDTLKSSCVPGPSMASDTLEIS